MAIEPLILLNGTTADANDVMSLFNEIYTDIDETNVGVGSKTGSGKFVLQNNPTINDLTLSSPIISSPTITGVSTFNSGADINVYSDVATTLKFSIDGATGDVQSAGTAYIGTLSEGQVFNGGISVSGTTFTITQADGSAISAAKPLFVGVKSNTSGRVVLAKFTAPISFTFGAASDTDGNLFGITNADWPNEMPFFLGVIYDGTTPYFTISRVPSYVSGAAASDLAQKGDTDADAQSDVMILATGLTLANFVNLPITQVGWFQMTYATAGGAWTASTSIHTGFNKEYEKIKFTFPIGQNGASSGTYILPNGGTAPVFSSNNFSYSINRNGVVLLMFNMNGDGGTDGATGNDAEVSIPFSSNLGFTTYYNFGSQNAIGGSYITAPHAEIVSGNRFFRICYNDPATGFNVTALSDFGNGGRELVGSFQYKI